MFVKKIIILIFFYFFSILTTFSQYKVTPNCLNTWDAIIDLRFEDADSLIENELATNPTNYYAHYLAQTADAFQFMIDMSDSTYKEIIDKYETRMELLDGEDEESPYYLACRAELQLQMGMFNIIYGDRLTGLRKAYGAYKKTYKNIDKYPDFNQSYKLDGIFNVAISNMPPFVNWAITSFGVSGSYDKGYEILRNYFINCKHTNGLGTEAALYNILAFKLNKDPYGAYTFINSLDSNYFKYNLLKYFKANVAYRTGKNEEALEELSTFKRDDLEFNGYNYLLGKILLRKLDSNSIHHLKKFLKNQKEKQYHKEINYAIAMAYLIAGNIKQTKHHRLLACETGNEITERDREAMCDCNLDYFPDKNLVKAKLLLDGGYLNKANLYLEMFNSVQHDKSDNSPYYLEYLLLKGRLEFRRGNTNEAVSLMSKVITYGENVDYYFASEAALYLGYIYEKSYPQKAVTYFNLARELYQSGFYEYIDEISKKKIKSLST